MDSGEPLRIGILGGTFNPVHLGHLILAQDACELFELAKVLFVPCAQAPHKSATVLASSEHRLAMLQAAIEDDPRFEVSDLELQRGGISYSVDTVRELKSRQPHAELCFIIGSDSLAELHLWKDVETLLTLCRFMILSRPGTDDETGWRQVRRLPSPWPDRLLAQSRTGHRVEISSSNIRHRVAEGLSIRYLVPPAVEMYVVEHHLYTQ